MGRRKRKKITIQPGVTSIGMSAFAICENLTEAVIPESIIEIAADAFEGCASMQ